MTKTMIAQLLLNHFSPLTLGLTIVFFALFNSGLYLCFDKWGWIKKYQVYKRRWMPVDCMFCLFFHAAWIELGTWYAILVFHFHLFPFDWFTCATILPLSLCSAVISRHYA